MTPGPENWRWNLRQLGHRWIASWLRLISERNPRREPIWKPIPWGGWRLHFNSPIPKTEQKSRAKVIPQGEFKGDIFRYNQGKCTSSVLNLLGFQGTWNRAWASEARLACFWNESKCGDRETCANVVDAAKCAWCKAMMGFPKVPQGMLVSGWK